MKHIVFMLIVAAFFIAGCAGNESNGNESNEKQNTILKFNDQRMQKIWDKTIEVSEAYKEVARAKEKLTQAQGNGYWTSDHVEYVDQLKQNLTIAEAEADERRKEFDELCNEYKK